MFGNKKYVFHYHHNGMNDDCEFTVTALGWVDAVNALLDAELKNGKIRIDYVDGEDDE